VFFKKANRNVRERIAQEKEIRMYIIKGKTAEYAG
jgi:hypothetical protein